MNKFEFDPVKHIYSVFGVRLPSATQVIGQILYPNEFRFVDDETMERASKLGRNVHKALETNFPDPLTDEELHCYNEAKRLLGEHRIVPLMKEARFYSRLGYAGTLDLYCLMDGELTIIDYKTGSTINKEKVAWQQSLYKNGLEESGLEVKKIYALHIPKKGKGKLIELTPKHKIEIEWLMNRWKERINNE